MAATRSPNALLVHGKKLDFCSVNLWHAKYLKHFVFVAFFSPSHSTLFGATLLQHPKWSKTISTYTWSFRMI